jgi:hypothetical protein
MHDWSHPTYKTILHYKSFEIVWEVMIYDATLLWVLDLTRTWGSDRPISLALSRFPIERRLRLLNPDIAYEDLSTIEILQEIHCSVEHHLQELRLHSGAMFLMFPLRTVFNLGVDRKECLLVGTCFGADCWHNTVLGF